MLVGLVRQALAGRDTLLGQEIDRLDHEATVAPEVFEVAVKHVLGREVDLDLAFGVDAEPVRKES